MNRHLEIKDLSVTRGYQPLIKDLTLSLKPGDVLQIKGSNGCGKTSLLLTLAGVLKSLKGSISMDTQSLGSKDLYWLGAHTSLKDSLSVGENLNLWAELEGRGEAEVIQALKALNIYNLIKEPLKNLSQGQRQRASLSRILIGFKPLWLLDEPFSHLDTEGMSLLLACFKSHLSQGGLILFTSHQKISLDNLKELDVGDFKPLCEAA